MVDNWQWSMMVAVTMANNGCRTTTPFSSVQVVSNNPGIPGERNCWSARCGRGALTKNRGTNSSTSKCLEGKPSVWGHSLCNRLMCQNQKCSVLDQTTTATGLLWATSKIVMDELNERMDWIWNWNAWHRNHKLVMFLQFAVTVWRQQPFCPRP